MTLKPNTKEVWKDIPGFIGSYQASNMGRIRSLNRKIWCSSNKSFSSIKGRILKLDNQNKSYYQVQIYKNGSKHYLVHKLIALAFILNPNNYPEINHKNLNKYDNRASNLEWCTRLQNQRHAHKNGKYDSFPKGEQRYNAILTDDAVYHIRKKELRNKEYCELYGVHKSTITMIQKDPCRWGHIKID